MTTLRRAIGRGMLLVIGVASAWLLATLLHASSASAAPPAATGSTGSPGLAPVFGPHAFPADLGPVAPTVLTPLPPVLRVLGPVVTPLTGLLDRTSSVLEPVESL